MRNVTILLAVAAVLALAGPASGDWVYWGGSSGGLYSVDANWAGGSKPRSWKEMGQPHDYAVVKNTGYILQNTPEYPWDVIIGGAVENTLYYVIETGAVLAVNEIDCGGLGSLGYKHGGLEQRGGTVTNATNPIGGVAADGINVGRYYDVAGNGGFYKITGGQIDFAGPLRVGGANASGLFHVVGTGPEGVPAEAISIGVASYNQGAKGTLQMDLNAAGAVAPITVNTDDDESILKGKLTLDASLYTPTVGDRVPVVVLTNSGADMRDELLDYSELTLDAPDDWALIDDGLGALSVKYVLGDLDEDGDVDQGDLNEVLSKWGQTQVLDDVEARWLGDPTCDETVDQGDLNEVLAAWGRSGLAGGSAPVPEPMTMSLLVIGGLGVLLKRKRKSRA